MTPLRPPHSHASLPQPVQTFWNWGCTQLRQTSTCPHATLAYLQGHANMPYSCKGLKELILLQVAFFYDRCSDECEVEPNLIHSMMIYSASLSSWERNLGENIRVFFLTCLLRKFVNTKPFWIKSSGYHLSLILYNLCFSNCLNQHPAVFLFPRKELFKSMLILIRWMPDSPLQKRWLGMSALASSLSVLF